MDTRPIGMFDSGCGGLTVLKEYMNQMPNEDFIYYGDTAHLPYGDKSPEKIIEYSEEIVKFLISKNVKLIIIACGTASATAYDYLKSKYNIEIKNIIEPTAKAIQDKNIGIIATKATVKSGAWEQNILKYNPNAKVTSVACPLFVPLIEEGLISNPATDYIIKEYMKPFFYVDSSSNQRLPNVSSLILGCTHYPILKEKLQNIIGPEINLVNAGHHSAIDTLNFLKASKIQNSNEHQGNIQFFASDDFNAFKKNAQILNFYID